MKFRHPAFPEIVREFDSPETAEKAGWVRVAPPAGKSSGRKSSRKRADG